MYGKPLARGGSSTSSVRRSEVETFDFFTMPVNSLFRPSALSAFITHMPTRAGFSLAGCAWRTTSSW